MCDSDAMSRVVASISLETSSDDDAVGVAVARDVEAFVIDDDDDAVGVETSSLSACAAELVIGADENKLLPLFENYEHFSNPFTNVCCESLKTTAHVGDALIRWRGRPVWLIERKEINDLVNSMRRADGRWLDQCARMQAFARVNGCRVLYLIEAPGRLLANPRALVNFTSIATIRAALADKIGRDLIVVHHSEDEIDTAQFLMDLAWTVERHGFGSSEPPPREDAFKFIPINKAESMTPENCMRLMVAQVPTVGRTKAIAIATHYGGSMLELVRDMARYENAEARRRYLYNQGIAGLNKANVDALVAALCGPDDAPLKRRRVEIAPALCDDDDEASLKRPRGAPLVDQFLPMPALPAKKPRKTPAEKKPRKTPAEKKPRKTSAEKKPRKTPAEKKPRKTPAEKKPRKPPAEKKSRKTRPRPLVIKNNDGDDDDDDFAGPANDEAMFDF